MKDNKKPDPPRKPRPIGTFATEFNHAILVVAAIALALILLGVVLGRMF
jgi:hypothetical protein